MCVTVCDSLSRQHTFSETFNPRQAKDGEIFRSTHACEQLFATMSNVKNKHCSSLTDRSLQSCVEMKATSYSHALQMLHVKVQE